MKTPVITRIELTPVFVPFNPEVQSLMRSGHGGLGMAIPAEDEWNGGDFVICRLWAEDGSPGLGEVFVWLPETGVSPGQVISSITGALGKYLLGESPFNVEKIRSRMDRNAACCEVAKGLLDMACYDLMGKIAGRPACDFMGGRSGGEVELSALVPLMNTGAMMEICARFHNMGFRSFRLKLGKGPAEDASIIRAFRDHLGDGVRLRVDYNQAYRPEEAVRAIRAIEPFGIDCAEQPVRADDFSGMAFVQKNVLTPLMAHEGCFSLGDFYTLVEMGAVRVLGINSERPGGITHALRAIACAERHGMGTVIHNQSLGIGSAMLIHLAAARYASLGHAVELFGHIMFGDDLISVPLEYNGGSVKIPAGPGFGVELDEEALAKHQTAPTEILAG